MTIQRLASLIAKAEGKKSKARIGDIREILKILVDIDSDYTFNGDIKNTPLWMLRERSDVITARTKKRAEKLARK